MALMQYWCGSIEGSGGFGWIPIVLIASAVGWYGTSVVTLQRRGGNWSVGRMVWAALGACAALAVTQGPIESSAMQRFSAHSVQHVALGMFVPLCIVAAAPLTLALRTARPATRRRLRAISESAPVRAVSHPAVALPIYLFTMVAVFFTPVFPAMMSSHVAHQAFNAHLVVAGTLFAWPLIGSDPSPHRIGHPARMGLVFLSLPLHSVGIMALLSATTLVGGVDAQRAAATAGFDALADQRLGASLMWVLGELVGLTAVGLAARRWFVADRAATRARLRRRAALPLAVATTAVVTGCGTGGLPEPASSEADTVVTLWWVFLIAAGVIGGLTMFLILFASVKFRRKDDSLPSQQQYHVPIEVAYTAIPILVVAGLFAVTVLTQNGLNELSDDPDVVVDVIGYQWQWEFRYPEEGARSAPVGQDPAVVVLPVDSTVRFNLTTRDVNHSFWVPELLEKRDLIPRVDNSIEVSLDRVGEFKGRCAEFCGLDHWRMSFVMKVVSQADYEAWLVDHQTDAPAPSDSGLGDLAPQPEAGG